MKFLSYDSKFSQVMLHFCNACWLNLLWFVCSIPIITIGASTTALYYVTLKIARGEEGNVTRTLASLLPMYFGPQNLLEEE